VSGLEKTNRSFIEQGLADSEQIIVVAPSEDGSHLIARELRNANVRVLELEPKGIYNAMNYGWSLSSSEWVMFLNSGDTFAHSDSLTLAASFLASLDSQISTVFFGGVVAGGGTETRVIPKSPVSPRSFAYGRTRVIHPSVVIRRQLLEDLDGFSEDLSLSADYELILRALSFPVAVSGSLLGRFELGGVSTTNISKSMDEARIARLRSLGLGRFARVADSVWFTYRKTRHLVAAQLRD